MFLLVLDKNPYNAANLVPKRYKHKQVLELMQMISCVVDFGYKQIPQGKEIKEWIKKNPDWVYVYVKVLMKELILATETKIKYLSLLALLDLTHPLRYVVPNAETAIFRYVKEYAEFTEYETNSELPIDVAVEEYKKYIEWKEKQYANRRTNTKRVI